MLKPLAKAKKEIMVDLPESVKTENPEKQFNKYLPKCFRRRSNQRGSKPLTESVTSEHTGDKDVQPSTEDGQDIVEIDAIPN